jgi:hypothetical protein
MKEIDKLVSCCAAGAMFVLGCIVEVEDGRDRDDRFPEPMEPAPPPASCTDESGCATGLSCIAGTCRPCSRTRSPSWAPAPACRRHA